MTPYNRPSKNLPKMNPDRSRAKDNLMPEDLTNLIDSPNENTTVQGSPQIPTIAPTIYRKSHAQAECFTGLGKNLYSIYILTLQYTIYYFTHLDIYKFKHSIPSSPNNQILVCSRLSLVILSHV